MRKNRTHNRSFSDGFIKGKASSAEKVVREEAKEVIPVKNPDTPVYRILWYSPETMTEEQYIGIKMVYENVVIDEVYDYPCHPNSIKERINAADVIAVSVEQWKTVKDCVDPLAKVAGPGKEIIYTYARPRSKYEKNCWSRYFADEDEYERHPAKLVSYTQIWTWEDLAEKYVGEYAWKTFIPQTYESPAFIAILLKHVNGQYRLYRFRFIEEHEFRPGQAPLLDEWVNCNTAVDLSEDDKAKIEWAAFLPNADNIILGYEYRDFGFNEETNDARLMGGYFTPIYANASMLYQDLGDTISS